MTSGARVWQHTLHCQIVSPYVAWSCTLPNVTQRTPAESPYNSLLCSNGTSCCNHMLICSQMDYLQFSLHRSKIDKRLKLCYNLGTWINPRERVRMWLQKKLPVLPGLQWSAPDLTVLLTRETTEVYCVSPHICPESMVTTFSEWLGVKSVEVGRWDRTGAVREVVREPQTTPPASRDTKALFVVCH